MASSGNPMVPTPTTPGMGYEESLYRGIALAQLRILKQQMQLGGLFIGNRRVRLDNGVEIFCNVSGIHESVQVTVPAVVTGTTEVVEEQFIPGFITHPRIGTVRGFQFPGHDSMRSPTYGIAHTGIGFKRTADGIVDEGDVTGASNGIPYPLDGAESKTYHFYLKNGEWVSKGPQQLLCGNVDWKGPADSKGNRRILTYKGNPSRYWPVGQFVEIPGLSAVDHFVDGLTSSYEYMTVFGDKVYEGGRVKATMPGLYHPLNTVHGGWEANHQNAQVLGAAIRQADGMLICIVKTCYNSYPRLKAAAGQEGFLVSAWHTYKDGVVYKDWLDDKSGAENQVADSNGALTLVEVPDPGRGYFVELIIRKAGNVPGGWSRLLRIPTPSWCDVNWFFSEDGTKACSVMFGELHQVVIDENTATHSVESLGGFKNTIKTVSDMHQEENPGTVSDWAENSLFGGVFREGIDVGDWITMSEGTRTYTSTKSGTTTYAADYKGNDLVKLDVSLSGNETVKKYGLNGKKWGQIALMPYYSDRWTPDKRIPGISINSYDPLTRLACVQVSGTCKPLVTIQGITLDIGQQCAVMPCVFGDITITASVVDEVTGLSASAEPRTYATYGGRWSLMSRAESFVDNQCVSYWDYEYVGGYKYYGARMLTTRVSDGAQCQTGVTPSSSLGFCCTYIDGNYYSSFFILEIYQWTCD